MKLSKTILPTLLLSFLVFQKANSQCDNSAIEYIAANKVKAAVLNGGDFFWNRNDGKFVVPYVPGQFPEVTTIFAAALWLGGIDAAGNLKVTHKANGNRYLPGPIDDSSLTIFDDGCENFNHIWKVSRGDILWVKGDFEDNGTINLPVPLAIKSWPARGNPLFENTMGFPLPDQELAPFFDRNGNGLYEPSNGEYPLIDASMPSVIPDEMTWCVFNASANALNGFDTLAVGAEVHFMAYAFNCSDDEVLNHTVFTRHKIFNKLGKSLFDFKMGLAIDMDLGCYADDYIGCDTLLNTSYAYNATNDDDGGGQCAGIGTYGENPPVQAVTFLNQKMSKMIFYQEGFEPPIFGTTSPAFPVEYYRYLSGFWKDGTPLTYGGNGYSPGSSNVVSYAFFDNPNDPLGWALSNLGWIPLYYRTIIMSMDIFELPEAETLILDAAFSYHRQPGADHLENVNVALAAVAGIKDFYDSGLSNCAQFAFCEADCVWPGDAGHDGIAKNDDLLYIGVSMGQNASGPPREPASNVWSPYNAAAWGLFPNNPVNQKHQDCNGDGAVNELDWYVLEKNYADKRPDYVHTEMKAPFVDNELYIELNKDELSTSSPYLQRLLKGDIYLAFENSPFPEIYGLAFTVKYDTSIWEPFGGNPLSLSNTTFFGNEDEVMTIEYASLDKGLMDVAFSRKDGQPVSDTFGLLGRFNLILKENAPTGNANGMQTFTFQIYDAVGVDADGNFFQLGAASDIVIGKDMVFDSTLTSSEELFDKNIQLTVSPNPSSGSFGLFFEKTNTVSQVNFFDLNGKIIFLEKIPAGTERHTIDLSGQLPTGIYFVKWVLADGKFTTKKVVVK